MSRVAYLSHPIGPDDDLVERGNFLMNANLWLEFLIEHTKLAIMCPWLAYVTAVGRGPLHGPRALRDQITLLERSDVLFQIGGWRSPHMEIEENHATRIDTPVITLLHFGERPPFHQDDIDAVLREIRFQMQRTYNRPTRRVWLPPLAEADIEALRRAQLQLKNEGGASTSEAARTIERIVLAASGRVVGEI